MDGAYSLISLIIYCIALFFTFLVLEHYIILKTHSRAHRLLPLVLGLIAVYEFYVIVELITGATYSFMILKKLLILNMLYLMLNYFIEFLNFNWPKLIDTIFFFTLMGANGIIIFRAYYRLDFDLIYFSAAWFYVISLIVIVFIVLKKYTLTKRRYTVSILLYAGAAVPGLGLGFRKYTNSFISADISMSIALTISDIIILYLLLSDQLVDEKFFLSEDLYMYSEVATVLVDADGYFLDANEKAHILIPEFIENIYHEQNRPGFMEEMKEILEKSEPIEYRANEKHLKLIPNAVYNRKHLKGYVLTIIDITEEKKKLIVSEEKRESAEQENYKKSSFLAQMSHDLRSPLHAILGISDILINKQDMLSKDRGLLIQMKQSGETLLEMVNSILDFSKLEAGKMELRSEKYNFEDIIREISINAAINVINKPVEYKLIMHTDYPKYLYGDENRIKEIIQNIISNAIKFTESGHVICNIWCDINYVSNTVRIKCAVEDTGSGISEEKLDTIFQEYVSYADEMSYEGNGLGLTIVKQLVTMMNGDAYAKSDGKTGSTITVEYEQELAEDIMLKACEKDGSKFLVQKKSWKPGVSPSYAYPSATVLVVDDMEVNRNIFKELVKDWQFSIAEADGGKKAIHIIKEKAIDMVFLDLMMPGLSGKDTVKLIREFSGIPVIALTADFSANRDTLCKEYGFTDVLYKPIDNGLLKSFIENMLPVEKRKLIKNGTSSANVIEKEMKGYRKILETYVSEVKPLVDELPNILHKDKDLFRIKVHGIKGISRQIGKTSIADQAEIMEMAAKASHIPYIEDHLDLFLENLKDVVIDVESEAKILKANEKNIRENDIVNLVKMSDDSLKEKLLSLQEAFNSYKIKDIEKIITELMETELSDSDRELMEKLLQYADDFMYEEGTVLLQERI